MSEGTSSTHPYTCLSCSLAFIDATSQREHYGSDLHRYNSKRRVAGLGSVTLDVFIEKVVGRQTEVKEEEDSARLACKACRKTFTNLATQQNHMESKKHKETVFRLASEYKVGTATAETGTPVDAEISPTKEEETPEDKPMEEEDTSPIPSTSSAAPTTNNTAELPFESSGDAKLDLLVARRLKASPPIAVTCCLFCLHTSTTPKENAAHMRLAHSFCVPEEEYLIDLPGLLRRLGEEIGTWNVCVYCGKGYGGNINLDDESDLNLTADQLQKKASKGVEAVRAHMISKSHCKLKYETEAQKLDLADFYDFRPSYPDYAEKQAKKQAKKAAKGEETITEEWEDVDGMQEDETADEAGMEIVYEEASEESSSEDSDSESDIGSSGITYGDSAYELVLPSGVRIGHRAHKNIHKQNLAPYLGENPFKPSAHSAPTTNFKPSPHSQALLRLVPRQMDKDRAHQRPYYESGLIPAKGAGFGGQGDVIRVRNKGEAKWAGKATRDFHEQKAVARQQFIRGIRANSQKYFRDPLLQ